jgi:mannose-1-phosphate guanylyltransferase
MDVGRIDIGVWASLLDISIKDEMGNVSHGDVIINDINNIFVRTDGRSVAT